MDKLLVDIDKVLDDLEESEKHQAASNYAFSQASCLSLKDEISSIQNQSLHAVSGGQLAVDKSPLNRPSVSPYQSASVADSIYESNYEPTYESFRKLNLASTSSPSEHSPYYENYLDNSFSNGAHDKSPDNPTNSIADKASTHSLNHNDYSSCLNDNPPDSDQAGGGEKEAISGEVRRDKPGCRASLSDTGTREQSKTQSDKQADEQSDAKLDQKFLRDNLPLGDRSLLPADDPASPGGFKENDQDDRSVQTGPESPIIRDKEIRNADATDEQSSASLKDELRIEQGNIADFPPVRGNR